jgi:hypothetical protein
MQAIGTFLFDWQPLLVGVLALAAGVAAYCAGLRQARAVEEQNRELKRNERRQLAREGIVATRLIDGILAKIEHEIARVTTLFEQPCYQKPDAIAPADWNRLIQKPNISVVFDKLGMCSEEILAKYMELDAEIEQYRERNISGVAYHSSAMKTFGMRVKFLRDSLDQQAQTCNKVLFETEKVD